MCRADSDYSCQRNDQISSRIGIVKKLVKPNTCLSGESEEQRIITKSAPYLDIWNVSAGEQN